MACLFLWTHYGVLSVIKFCWSTAGSKRISFITEGLPWKITVSQLTIGVYRKKQQERRSRCTKKERERRSRPTRTLILRASVLDIAQQSKPYRNIGNLYWFASLPLTSDPPYVKPGYPGLNKPGYPGLNAVKPVNPGLKNNPRVCIPYP